MRVKSLYVVCFFQALILFSQDPGKTFKHLSTEQGLSQSSVIAIQQDSVGQMWIGTRDGLNRYDGSKFTVFRTSEEDTLSISNNDILSIEVDFQGKVWIGTYNGLNSYDTRTETFTRFLHTPRLHSIGNNTIWCVKSIDADHLWVGTSDGLSVYNNSQNTFQNYQGQGVSKGIPGKIVLSILKTKEGRIFLGTNAGISEAIIEQTGEIHFRSFSALMSQDAQRTGFVQNLTEAPDGSVWVGTKSNGLFRFYPDREVLEHILSEDIDNDIRAMAVDKDGVLWMGTYNGVRTLDGEGNIEKYEHNGLQTNSLSKNTIKSVFRDQRGSIWIGAYYGGINVWDKTNNNFINYSEQKGKKGLSYEVISSLVAYNNKVYFGTEGRGVSVLDLTSQGISHIAKGKEDVFGMNVKALMMHSNHKLWMGTFNNGVEVYDVDREMFSKSVISENLKSFLASQAVYALQEQNEDIVWIGTFGRGLVRYHLKEGSFTAFNEDPGRKALLTSNFIRTLLLDSKGRLWAGTQNGLNCMFNPRDSVPSVRHFFYDKNSLAGEDILTLFEDQSAQVWVGTKSKGLFRYNGTDFEKVRLAIDTKEVTTIHCILEDGSGNFWISSNQGIIKYSPSTKETLLYNIKDGLVSNEFNDNAGLKVNNRLFFFGGPAGVTSFNPENITINDYSPQVFFTGFDIRNQKVDPGQDEHDILETNIMFTKEVTLPYNRASFTLHFAIPNFINPSNNQYAYRLNGLEDEWKITSNTEVSYAIQKPGTYTFEVKGANNDGVWNENPTRLLIHVKPAPWRTGWAFLLYSLLIGAALLGLIWVMKSKSALRHRLELEKLERERNQEIHQAKLQFFTNISHEFRTPLTLILGPLQQLLSDYKGSNKMYKKLLVIESSAKHLLQLINRLMDFRKLESNQVKLESAEGNIVKFLKEIYLSFTEFAKNGKYEYTFSTSDEYIPVFYDRPKLERVFYNLISNAFRYTPKGGKIDIHLEKEEHTINIYVKDSGIGIAEEYQDKIFDRFFEIGSHLTGHKNYNQGTGIGLSIVKSIVALHKGEIKVISKVSEGTTFMVTLPLERGHLKEDEILKNFKFSDDLSQYINQLEKDEVKEVRDIEEYMPDESKPTILVVEDNQPLREFMKNLLKKEYNILEAENGNVAYKMALKHIPDLIISDVIMPEMVGTELCSRIKDSLKTSHIPVILLTSRTSLIYKFEGLESGADDYISKPFNVKEFKLRVKNLLESIQRLKNKFASSEEFSPSEITVSSLDEVLLKKALKIVEENISNEQFDIPTFSSELGVSRTMLFTKIRAWTNHTPNEFIHEIRMKRAAQLLEMDKINISEVSYMVGFRNPKYFTKCFQKRFGLTPSQFLDKFSAKI